MSFAEVYGVTITVITGVLSSSMGGWGTGGGRCRELECEDDLIDIGVWEINKKGGRWERRTPEFKGPSDRLELSSTETDNNCGAWLWCVRPRQTSRLGRELGRTYPARDFFIRNIVCFHDIRSPTKWRGAANKPSFVHLVFNSIIHSLTHSFIYSLIHEINELSH